MQRVVHDRPWAEALQQQLAAWGTRRVVLATTRSLLRDGGLAHQVAAALADVRVATVGGLRAHAPRPDVVRLVQVLREHGADALVGLGGGSVTSAVKIARLALANGVTREDEIDRLIGRDGLAAPGPRCAMLPTTLSAGEYTGMAGTTDPHTHRKQAVRHPALAPELVILDPALARDTPRALWLGTGLRALDHIVETWCSPGATRASDAACLRGLPLLLRGLREGDAAAAQLGARAAIEGLAGGVPQGASHGIGHALGGVADVGHGDTTCVMLPHVLRYNAPVNGARQRELALRWEPSGRGLDALVEELVASFALPGRLRDTGMDRTLLPAVAREALASPWVAANPRPLRSEGDILDLLRQAW